MTTKSVRNVKLVMGKNGKPTLKRTHTYKAKNKAIKADREAKAWSKRSKT